MTTGIKLSIEDLLVKLENDGNLPTVQELAALSDLSRAELRQVRAKWTSIAEPRRLHVIRSLVEDSYTNLHLHLGRLLRLALTDENSQIRRLAIQGLWEDTGEDLIGPFVHILHNDPEVEVRAAAAGSLGAFVLAGELDELAAPLAMRVEEALLAILHSEMESLAVQCRALESIAFSGETGVRQLIEDGYYSPYEEMRLSALRAMGRSADTRWRGAARAELDNPSAAMRAEAARACGELETRAALDELIELLGDEEKSVRLAAIFALGRIGGRRAEEVLAAMAASDDPDETEAAAEALEEAIFYGDADDIPLFDEAALDWADELDDLDDW